MNRLVSFQDSHQQHLHHHLILAMENREMTSFLSQKIDSIVFNCVSTIALVFSTLELDLRKVGLEIQVEMVMEFTICQPFQIDL